MQPLARWIVGSVIVLLLVHLFLTQTNISTNETMSTGDGSAAASHAELQEGMQDLLSTLTEMGYLPIGGISIPPHERLPSEGLRAAGFGQDVVDLVSRLTSLSQDLFEEDGLDGDGIALAPSSIGVSYLSDLALSQAREVNSPSGEGLPASVLKLAWGGRDIGKSIAYDLTDKNIAEWSTADNDARDWTNARRTPVAEYFQRWVANFRDLEWLPWHDDLGYIVLPCPRGYEQHIADPSTTETDVQLRHVSLTSTGLAAPSFEQMLSDRIDVLKAEQNLYWSKRRLFEEAGWGQTFDLEQFQAACEDYEQQFREATSLARVGPKGQSIYNVEYGQQLREWYRSKAGAYGV